VVSAPYRAVGGWRSLVQAKHFGALVLRSGVQSHTSGAAMSDETRPTREDSVRVEHKSTGVSYKPCLIARRRSLHPAGHWAGHQPLAHPC
jgi:hypothetical protein